jgi:hypothetical protein
MRYVIPVSAMTYYEMLARRVRLQLHNSTKALNYSINWSIYWSIHWSIRSSIHSSIHYVY